MKLLSPLNPVLFSAMLVAALCSCERTKTTQTERTTTDRDTTAVTHTETRTKAKDELHEFRDWVNAKTSGADSNARERWPKVKEEFKTRTDKLESRLDTMSAKSKQEYAELKSRYKAWEQKQEKREDRPLDPKKLTSIRQQLLGKQSDLKTVTSANIRQTYETLLQYVRGTHNSWTPDDWDYVDYIYSELNNRKDEVEGDISTKDGLKIKALQGEYLGYEAAADTKDAAHHLKK
ncbi:hypothetical protein [Adhaeribacter soli]|uniref:Lipoprotein n=1 Tax=Adhaeribacter soli TaxID=2607655 RepID=A0A5N1J2C4_9BACT|nr:hypothetical protein [Adhaeribacter soli]KAA9340656.1 hypothetical protein F0P94_04300 [Adhaeribacter soli]